MNRFTIDSHLLETHANDYDFFLNILLIFAQDNPFCLCVDDKSYALKAYYTLATRNEFIMTWLDWMSKTNYKFFCKVEFCDIEDTVDLQSLFLKIAAKASPTKQLVVSNKQMYNQHWESFIRENAISLLDVSQLRDALNNRVIMISHGDNSPIVFGNNNVLNNL